LPGLTNNSGRGESRLIHHNPDAAGLSEEDQGVWLDILSLTEIGVDTLDTYPTHSNSNHNVNAKKEEAFNANFISAITIASEQVLSHHSRRPVSVSIADIKNLIPVPPPTWTNFDFWNTSSEHENGKVICDLSVGLSSQYPQKRTSRAIDLASGKYGFGWRHECFNWGVFGLERDKRVFVPGGELIDELMKRRALYLSSTQVGPGPDLDQVTSTSSSIVKKVIKYKQD
jgi:hypothetical protein